MTRLSTAYVWGGPYVPAEAPITECIAYVSRLFDPGEAIAKDQIGYSGRCGVHQNSCTSLQFTRPLRAGQVDPATSTSYNGYQPDVSAADQSDSWQYRFYRGSNLDCAGAV